MPTPLIPLTNSDKGIASFWLNYQPDTLIAKAYAQGREIDRKKLVRVGPAAGSKLTAEVTSLTTSKTWKHMPW